MIIKSNGGEMKKYAAGSLEKECGVRSRGVIV
jgi:hypothetical protein